MTKETLLISVTKSHIRNGCPGSPRTCAIALALKDNISIDGTISVGKDKITLCPVIGTPQYIDMPSKAVKLREDFDADDGSATPTIFKISIPKTGTCSWCSNKLFGHSLDENGHCIICRNDAPKHLCSWCDAPVSQAGALCYGCNPGRDF